MLQLQADGFSSGLMFQPQARSFTSQFGVQSTIVQQVSRPVGFTNPSPCVLINLVGEAMPDQI